MNCWQTLSCNLHYCVSDKKNWKNKHRHYFTFCKTQFHYKIRPFIWNFALIFADENGFFLPPPSASLEKWQLVPWEINTVALLGSLFHLYQGTAVDLAARVVAFNCDWLYWAGRGFCTCIILRVDLYLPNFNFNGQFFYTEPLDFGRIFFPMGSRARPASHKTKHWKQWQFVFFSTQVHPHHPVLSLYLHMSWGLKPFPVYRVCDVLDSFYRYISTDGEMWLKVEP